MHFYRNTFDTIQRAQEIGAEGIAVPCYDTLFNFLLGIYGIPLYFIQKCIGVDIRICFKAVAYGKSVYLFALAAATFIMYRICIEAGVAKVRAKWAVLLFITSSLTTSCVAVIGQSDIIGIVFILAGIYNYIKRDEKKFLLWFIIAYPFKQYVMFTFLPLMLLRDKNCIRFLAKTGIVLLTDYLMNFIMIRNDRDIWVYKQGFSSGMLELLLENRFPFAHEGVPIVVLLLGLLCVYCYLTIEPEEKCKRNDMTIFVALASMSIVFVGFPSNPYWYIHLVPYMMIASVYYVNETKRILLFETVGSAAIVFSNYVIYYWCYDINNMKDMLLYRLVGNPNIKNMAPMMRLAHQEEMGYYQPIAEAVFVVCMVTICWLCRPRERCSECNLDVKNFDMEMKQVSIIRLAINTALCALPVCMFIMSVKG